MESGVNPTSPSILVVENDPLCREFYESALGLHGFQVHSVDNGSEALSYLHQSGLKPLLVILDLGMPGMDGRTFLECQSRIRAISDLPVLVITGDTGSHDPLPGNVQATLAKPVSVNELLDAVKSCLQIATAQSAARASAKLSEAEVQRS
jgi:CheY-like chemotaxis protein